MNISEALRWAHKQLKSSTTPELDARVLLMYVLGWTPVQLISGANKSISQPQQTRYKKLVASRRRGVPVAYLTGKKEFYGLKFKVSRAVLIPRPETEAIVEEAIKTINKIKPKVIYEIGTGSGAIAIAIAKHLPKVKVIASDISASALNVARNNIKHHQLAKQIKLIKNSLANHIQKPALVVANLPYLPTSLQNKKDLAFEPKQALFAKDHGLELYKKMFANPNITTAIIELGENQYAKMAKWLEQKYPQSKITPIYNIDKTIVGLKLFR